MRLQRTEPPSDDCMVVAIDNFGRLVTTGDNGPRYFGFSAPGDVPEKEALIQAVLRACEAIWPMRWGPSYHLVFDANPTRLVRHLPPVKILKVLAWAATHDHPAEIGAALVAVAKGVDAVDLMAAEKAFEYAK